MNMLSPAPRSAEASDKFHRFRLISFDECREMVGFKSRTSVYTAIANDPNFPKPITRGRNRFFLESEVLAYIRGLAAQRKTAKPEPNEVSSGGA
ncbi:hypothetical protein [Solimonas marina]|uniref:Transcriptional regulator, AlpA family n=1 Tax=Solimonas marina TaxID=2714601 RepID=A0A969W9Q2_9GAMM|nr:hypothetical protein [Solimonas marina]NKF23237.1 hypothetical protein [Solimonas marina]